MFTQISRHRLAVLAGLAMLLPVMSPIGLPSAAFAKQATVSAGPYLVFFKPSSAELTPRAKKILDSVAARFIATGAQHLNITGVASHIGDAQESADMARAYETNVRDYLVTKLVPVDSMLLGQRYGTQNRATIELRKNSPARRRVEIEMH